MLLSVLVNVVAVTVAVQVAAAAARSAASTSNRADDVNFLLWTRSNPDDDQFYLLLQGDADNLAASPLTPSDPTVVVVHGYVASGYIEWARSAKTELLNLGTYNVISVDWETLAGSEWYPESALNTQVVGERTARLLEWLQEGAGLDVTQVQAAGHSLGAQVCGAIGQHLQNFSLPFITGLDPAGPLFHNVTTDFRLDPSDAEFVQVIHTNGCPSDEGCVGMEESCGDVDFFPNGGKYQPGCLFCSHERVCDLWIESINGETPFLAHPCSSWEAYEAGECDDCGQGCLEMGFHVRKDLTGDYFLSTNGDSPYAMG